MKYQDIDGLTRKTSKGYYEVLVNGVWVKALQRKSKKHICIPLYCRTTAERELNLNYKAL
jgi:hypothetical protein